MGLSKKWVWGLYGLGQKQTVGPPLWIIFEQNGLYGMEKLVGLDISLHTVRTVNVFQVETHQGNLLRWVSTSKMGKPITLI